MGADGETRPLTFFTICSRNYLAQAHLLVASLRAHHPDAEVMVVLADQADDQDDLAAFVDAKIVLGADLGIPTYHDMAMRYDIVEFNTALKPYAFLYLFNLGAEHVVYLDPDIEVMAPLKSVEIALQEGFSAVITPHITQPLDMSFDPTELKIIRTGIYNLGFLALSNSKDACRFAWWWAARMPTDCRVDLDAGLFVDQKYVDLLPSYVSRTHILRDPGYNVAYWNLAQRSLKKGQDGRWLANDRTLSFMHYSGIRTSDLDAISVHQNRIRLSDLGEGKALFESYAARLKEARSKLGSIVSDLSYRFDKFVSGDPILPLLRQVYARDVAASGAPYEEIFDMSKGPYLKGATGIYHDASHLISPVMADLWRRKGYLQAAFDVKKPSGAEAFALWFAATGHKEWGIDKAFVPQAVWDLQKRRKTWKSRLAILTFRLIELSKKTAFLYPKPVRRAAVRLSRERLPALAKSIRGR